MTDIEYIDGFSANNETTIAKFYNEYRVTFCSYFKSHYNKEQEYVVDLFQDSCLAVYNNVQSGRLTSKNLTSNLKTYLFQIGKYSLMARDRKEHNLQSTSLDSIYIDEDGNEHIPGDIKAGLKTVNSDEEYYREKTEREEFVERVVSDMKPPCSKILTLFYWNKKSMSDIATAIGMSGADSVKTQKFKCMKKLDTLLRAAKDVFPDAANHKNKRNENNSNRG